MNALRVNGCQSCGFLEINDDPGHILTTDFHTLSLATDQLYLGRAYLTLGRYASKISDLTGDESSDMWDIIKRYELATAQTYGAAHLTIATLMNNAYKSPNPQPHVHSHLRPRYTNAPNIGGAIFEDPNFGEHYIRNRSHNVAPEFLHEIAQPLRALMAN
ncbi:MAG: hypothetical protein QG623_326 [Patescibacteria group bacterium]|nr:hypothetical protein [Patescibacteria group bacterium]